MLLSNDAYIGVNHSDIQNAKDDEDDDDDDANMDDINEYYSGYHVDKDYVENNLADKEV